MSLVGGGWGTLGGRWGGSNKGAGRKEPVRRSGEERREAPFPISEGGGDG